MPETTAPLRWWRAAAFIVVTLALTVGGAIGEARPGHARSTVSARSCTLVR